MKATANTPITKHQIFKLVQPDLEDLELRLKSEAVSSLHLVEQMNEYLHDSGGKRLRPGLLLLISKMLGATGDSPIQLGVVVELIHVATLVHDDIIDNSEVRRGRASVNARWGNELTVLFGDWLYMTAFAIALKERKFGLLDVLIDVTRKMVEGELLQLERGYRLDATEDDYLKICWHKTAHLFSGCGRLGAQLAGVDGASEERLSAYGNNLGMAFQLTDDLLDFTSDQKVLGKPVLKDLQEGNITLPIIKLLEKANPDEKRFLVDVVELRDFSENNKRRILELIDSYSTLDELKLLAARYASDAFGHLNGFPQSDYRDALQALPELVITRKK